MALSITGISVAEVPDLVGDWTCSGSGYRSEAGYFEEEDVSNLIFSIEEQNGRLFTGNFTYEVNGTVASEAFAGAISADNKTYYIVYASGLDWFNVGTIISDNEIDQMYMQISEPGEIFVDRLYRTVEDSAEPSV